VDKTERMFEMVKNRTLVFLSRPRRFGKTLLVSTLQHYFQGEKELFKGLKIYDLEKNWTKHPVIRLDMSSVKDDNIQQLPISIGMILSDYEKEYGIVPVDGASCGARFCQLIKTAYRVTGQKVVVLIDEYDSPLLNHLHDGMLPEFKEILQNIYQQIKVCEDFEKFVFLTGITRFSQVSIFSTLNNLRNISMDDEFSDICGFSKEEVLDNFKEDIDRLAEKFNCDFDTMVEKLKYMYDGYHFSGDSKDMFNPISLLTCFETKKLKNYWFETATPTFIINHLRRFNVDIRNLDKVDLMEDQFYVSPDVSQSLCPLLYQSGYLTIKDYYEEYEMYTLGYPNQEVRVSMAKSMMDSWVGYDSGESRNYMMKFYFAIKRGDFDEGLSILKDFFLQIPNVLNNKDEKHFQTIIYVLFTWLGFYNRVEVNTSVGRIDCVLFSEKYIFVIEFKVDQSAQIAMDQINQRGYVDKFKSDGRQIVKVGINMSSQLRTISEWKIEIEQ